MNLCKSVENVKTKTKKQSKKHVNMIRYILLFVLQRTLKLSDFILIPIMIMQAAIESNKATLDNFQLLANLMCGTWQTLLDEIRDLQVLTSL